MQQGITGKILTVFREQCHVCHVCRPHDIFHFRQFYACQRPAKHNIAYFAVSQKP